jgi:hypothetical protein
MISHAITTESVRLHSQELSTLDLLLVRSVRTAEIQRSQIVFSVCVSGGTAPVQLTIETYLYRTNQYRSLESVFHLLSRSHARDIKQLSTEDLAWKIAILYIAKITRIDGTFSDKAIPGKPCQVVQLLSQGNCPGRRVDSLGGVERKSSFQIL